MYKIKGFSYISLVMLLVFVSVVACQPVAEKPEKPNNDYNNGNIEEGDGIIDGNDAGNDMNNLDENDVVQRSEMIAGNVVELNGVDRAVVVITDNTAIVGVDTNYNNDNEIPEDLKNQIESTVKSVDYRIDDVRITSDEEVYDKINDIVLSLRTGRPIKEFSDEIRDILDRITTEL